MSRDVDLDAVTALIRGVAEECILPRFRRLAEHEIREKAPGNLVTIADTEAELALSAALGELLPGSAVVGEEAVAGDAAVLDRLAEDHPTWIIDPVDGTMNFAKAVPRFAVMVALVKAGELRAGWIHDPLRGATAAARAGGGAWLLEAGHSRRRLACAPMPPLARARGATAGRIAARGRAQDVLERSGRVGPLHRVTCAGHEYLDLVEGRLDYAVFGRTLPWDHAAGVLIHREAGGKSGFVDDLAGDEAPYTPRRHTGPFLAAPNRQAWAELRAILLTA